MSLQARNCPQWIEYTLFLFQWKDLRSYLVADGELQPNVRRTYDVPTVRTRFTKT